GSDDRVELTLQPRLLTTTSPVTMGPRNLGDRRGAGRDQFGNWYWISAANTEIRVNSVGSGITSHFWSPGDGTDCEKSLRPWEFLPIGASGPPRVLGLSGLAVTEHNYLVVGVVDPPGLLIFDLYSGGPPTQIQWPGNVPFRPFDIAAAP